MSKGGQEDWIKRGELIIHLRQGIRKTRQLAQRLLPDPLVGCEAKGLLGRLESIRDELDRIQAAHPPIRHFANDPFWSPGNNKLH